MARVMPPDGLCLYHAVRYAQNPRTYDSVATAQNGMLIGAGSKEIYDAAAELRREMIDACVSAGLHDQANRLRKTGNEGYPEEEDFAMLAGIASVPFEIIIEAAPNMQPIKYGDGNPRARFILKLISDDAGHQSAHWDVDALYDHNTKRRRITGKKAVIPATAAPAEMCDDGPPKNIHAHEIPEIKDINALQIEDASTDAPYDVSPDIVEMERAVGQLIRDAGNPQERDLYPMLKKLGKQYTQKQIRTWKKHYGHAPDTASGTISSHAASSSSTGAQLMTDTPGVPADIQEMEKTVGQFIRSKGNPERPTLYAMLRSEEHHYTHRQVELWKKHYGHTGPVDEELKDIDAEAAVSQYRDDVESCASLGGGCKRLMKRLLSKGVCMTEHQARLALIQVKYAHLPNAHVNQWEEFTDILQQGQSMEDTICNIAEKRGWLVSLKNMRSMRSEYEKQLTVSELERRYHLGFWGRSHSGGGLGGFGRGPISNHVFVFSAISLPPGSPS